MEQIKKEGTQTLDEEKWVHDSSVDHKGRAPLRASTGSWRAALFIIALEFGERLSYFGIATSLIIYLTKVIHQDLGRFYTVLASSIVYLLGLLLLTMSRILPDLKPCETGYCQNPRRIHKVFFFLAIYLISIGTAGHKPALESFGADQFDDDHPEERRKKMSFFNWWNIGLCCGLLLGVTVIVYIQDHMSYAAADIILTAVLAFSTVIFCSGRPFYRFRKPTGSPLTPMLQVLVAAISKRNLAHPTEPDQLYEVSRSEKTQGRLLFHTKSLKFLDKAAIIEIAQNPAESELKPWRLATVTKVEEMKLIVNMIPIWFTTLPFGICAAQAATFFIKQGTTLNRKITHNFMIPPASIYAMTAIGMIASVAIYDKILMPLLRKVTGNERGISILQRIGFGMIFSVVTMVVAALVESKRLNIAENNSFKGSVSMSVLWLAPQFLIIGIGDGFTLVGLQEYFYDQVPDSMRSLGIAFYLSVIGVGNFLSSLLITLVDHITEKRGKSWFGKDLNSSRLDYFYWFLACVTIVNLGVYAFIARRYSYKNVQITTAASADGREGD